MGKKTICEVEPLASWYEPNGEQWSIILTDDANRPFTSKSSVVVVLQFTIEQLREFHATVAEAIHYAEIEHEKAEGIRGV